EIANESIKRLENEMKEKNKKITNLQNQISKLNEVEKDNQKLKNSLTDLTVHDGELIAEKDNEIKSLNAKIVQKNGELEEKRQEIERLSVQILGLEANAIADKQNLNIQLGAEEKKYQELQRDFDNLKREATVTIRNLEGEVEDLEQAIDMFDKHNQNLTEAWKVPETQAEIEELKEIIEGLEAELEFYRGGNDYQSPQQEAENNFCQELARQENLEQAKEYLRELIPDLNQAEQNSITTIASVEELIRGREHCLKFIACWEIRLNCRTSKEPIANQFQVTIEGQQVYLVLVNFLTFLQHRAVGPR